MPAVVGVIHELNTGSSVGTTATIKTKRFDFGLPEERKKFNHIVLNYTSGADVSVKIYLDGSAVSSETVTFSSQSISNAVSKRINHLGKTIEIAISSASGTFSLESLSIEYELVSRTP